MDYTGIARGATVQGAVGAGAVWGVGAGTVWLVIALCMMLLGVVMYAAIIRRNRLDARAAGIVPVRRHFLRRHK